MVRVDTRSYIAHMVKHKTFGDRAYEVFIRPTMSPTSLPLAFDYNP